MDADNTTRTQAENALSNIAELASVALRRVQRGDQIMPRLLDVDDAGRYLAMSDKAVRELLMRGELPYIQKVAGRSPYLIDIRDLDCWIEKNKQRPQ